MTNYAIRDDSYEGKLFSVSPVHQYRSGNGCLRTIVVEAEGLFGEKTYVPVTVFGADALECRDEAVGMGVRVTARLKAGQYTAKDGTIRWMLSYSALHVELLQTVHEQEGRDEPEHERLGMDDPGVQDDIPF